jgi:hypothetical protein
MEQSPVLTNNTTNQNKNKQAEDSNKKTDKKLTNRNSIEARLEPILENNQSHQEFEKSDSIVIF